MCSVECVIYPILSPVCSGRQDTALLLRQRGHNKQPFDKLLLAADTINPNVHDKMNNSGVGPGHRPEGMFIYLILNLPESFVLRVLSCKAAFLLLQPAMYLSVNGLFCLVWSAALIVMILIPTFATRIV